MKNTITKLTDSCSILQNQHGQSEVYEMTKEELMRLFQKETGKYYSLNRGLKRNREEEEEEEELKGHENLSNGDETNSLVNNVREESGKEIDYGEKIWEFRWMGDDLVNGPYSEYEMKHWKDTYFNNQVEVRKIGNVDFRHILNVIFDQ